MLSKYVLVLFFATVLVGVAFFVAKRFNRIDPITLENFDDLWKLGDPAIIEQKMCELLPKAKELKDKSVYLQMLSQVALLQAMQKKFDEANKALDEAQALLAPEYPLAKVRILLERGRVLQQEMLFGGLPKERVPGIQSLFEQSYELSAQHHFDFHTINAAHMIAIIVQSPQEKIMWNQRAIDLAGSSNEKRAKEWLGSLYSNLGQSYIEAKEFEKALVAFQKALVYRIKEGHASNDRVARWMIARTLRLLGRFDEALAMQLALAKEWDKIAQSGKLDMPAEMFTLTRGWVYEELAEIYQAKAKELSGLALDILAHNEMFRTTSPERLERLKQIQKNTVQ